MPLIYVSAAVNGVHVSVIWMTGCQPGLTMAGALASIPDTMVLPSDKSHRQVQQYRIIK